MRPPQGAATGEEEAKEIRMGDVFLIISRAV
jgi:hypothetical protein